MHISLFQTTRYLFLLTAAVLIAFGIGSLLRVGAKPENAVLYGIYTVFMLGDAAVMAFCAWQLPKRTRFIFYLSVVVLALNIFPTIFDQFGLVDLLFVLLNIATFIFLILARKEFHPA